MIGSNAVWRRAGLLLCAVCLLSLGFVPTAMASGPSGVLDSRAWEMVSPVEKNGGEVAPPGAGVLAAGGQGGVLAFASNASFGEAAGATPLSQYVATRSGAGWSTANVTPPVASGTYEGDPYFLFSADLSRAVVSSGWRCRSAGGEECEAEAPPLGPGGPAGYRNAYLRQGSGYTPLITAGNFPALPAEPQEFHLAVKGGSPDLHHVVFSSAGLLYEWNDGTIVQLGGSGATLAAPGNALGAVSEDGSRAYFEEGASLRLREGGTTKLVAAGAEFGAASADGATAFYLQAGHVHRYAAAAETSEDLTPGGGATAILGTSPAGTYLFFVAAGGIFRWHAGSATKIVSDANLGRLPPVTGPADVAADGARLFFTTADSLIPLSDSNGQPDAYEWEAQGMGSCAVSPGCLGLLSSGRTGSATFVASSASGDDAFFLTAVSLLPADPSSLDAYDARSGGGFPEPTPGIECLGDECQGAPFVPEEPAPGSGVVSGPANPPVAFPKAGCPKGKRAVKRHGKTVCLPKKKHRKHQPGGAR